MNVQKGRIALSFALMLIFSSVSALDLKLHYTCDSTSADGTKLVDVAGGQYDGTLLNGAAIRDYGQFRVLDLGQNNGYIDLGATFGTVLSGLSDFSISTYLYVDESTALWTAGNFIWAFGNSNDIARDANGAYFLSAKSTRYAISRTHWQGEQSVREGNNFPQGKWRHIVYTQNGTTGILYIDGQEVARDGISILPENIGATTCNYIGRSVYSTDVYLKGALYYDFRIYDGALASVDLIDLSSDLNALNITIDSEELEQVAGNLNLPDTVYSDLALQTILDGVEVSWLSSNEQVVSAGGEVKRPSPGEVPVKLELTANMSLGNASFQKIFKLVVMPYPNDEVAVNKDYANLTLEGNLENLRQSLYLATEGIDGSTIVWSTTAPDFIAEDGTLLKLSAHGEGKQYVQLTATVSKGDYTLQRTFDIYVAEDDDCSAYLFSYFTGNSGDQEAIRFALSYDGYNYIALNDNNPIISSAQISSTGGVRDPHILRGPDNNFYMVVTDMVSAYGWSSNRAMVMLKSSDLVNWTSSVVNIQQKYDGQEDLERVWAPQTIYDENEGKYMLYWSMKYTGGADIIYYAYANDDFTDIIGEPQQLFFHPENLSCIDGDIILKDGVYNLFFKTEGSGNGIKKAVSSQLTAGYKLIDKYYQQTTEAVEGSSVFRMINSDKYILMYDMYSSGKYQFTESYDLDNFTVVDDEVSMNFHPRHGTVIPITADEAQRLAEEWASINELVVYDVQGDHIDGGVVIDNVNRTVTIRTSKSLEQYDPKLIVFPGVNLGLEGPQDFSEGSVTYTLSIQGVGSVNYQVDVISTATPLEDVSHLITHKLYPNPATTYLNVEQEALLSNNTLYVYDMTGRNVLVMPLSDKITTINIERFSSSIYCLMARNEGGILWEDLLFVE